MRAPIEAPEPLDTNGPMDTSSHNATSGATTADTLRTALRERLAGFKVPREFRFVPELPKTATGKIRKPDLRSTYSPRSDA